MTTHPNTPVTREPDPADAPIVVHLSAMDRMLPCLLYTSPSPRD